MTGKLRGWRKLPFFASVAVTVGIMAAVLPVARAGNGPTPLSPAWFAARGGGTVGASASAAAAAPQLQTLQNVRTSLQSLNAAKTALQKAMAAQATTSATTTSVPDGLTVGGLQLLSGSTPQSATAPTQSIANGHTSVTVKQTAPAAIINWSSFNVGSHTNLTFDQSAGGSSATTWAALNRVTSTTANPSQILGQINAQGQVYIINPNGIVFGAGSQINLHALVASSAAFTDAQFLSGTSGGSTGGIYGTTPTFTGAAAPVIVEPGAMIATAAPSSATSGGGFVLLLGANVQNGGAIFTPDGQAVMAAGVNFILQPGYSVTGTGSNGLPVGPNLTATVVGSVVAPVGAGSVSNTGLVTATTGDITMAGSSVTQAGVLLATTSVSRRGTVHLLSDLVASSTASSGYALDPASSVVLAPGSATLILNDTSGATALGSQRASAIAASIAANQSFAIDQQPTTGTLPALQYVRLPDVQDQSRIEITAGGTVEFQAGSLTMATGGQLAVSAGAGSTKPMTGRVVVDAGAMLDVSGSLAAVLPVTANAITVQIESFELRDDPLNRDTNDLNNATVQVDARQLVSVPASSTTTVTASNGYSQARDYTAGGLLEVSGELSNVGHTIDEYTASGGTVALSAPLVVTRPGSVVNIAGGAITYQAGAMPQSWLIASNGQLYNVNTAPSTVTYTGVYSGQTFTEPRWNISATYASPIVAPSSFQEPGYIVGRDAGTLTVSAPTAVLDGTINAGVVSGAYQNAARSSAVTDPFLQPQTAVPLGGTFDLSTFATYALTGTTTGLQSLPNPTTVTIGTQTGADGIDIGIDTAVPAAVVGTTTILADSLNQAQLGRLLISASGATVAGGITINAPLTLGNGAVVSLSAPSTVINANLTARGGSVSVSDVITLASTDNTDSPVLLGTTTTAALSQNEGLAAGATIDTRGLWTNALLSPTNLAGEAYVNGGSVSFTSTRGIALAAGSLIDASSGGAITSQGGTTAGTGGAIAILADTYAGPVTSFFTPGAAYPVTLAGTLRSIGGRTCPTTSGCGFSLTAPAIAIGDGLTAASVDQVVLPSGFFSSGFLSYTLNGTATDLVSGGVVALTDAGGNVLPGLSVGPGTQLNVVAPTYQFTTTSRYAPTGSDPSSALTAGLQPLYLPNLQTATLAQRPSASLALNSYSSALHQANALDQGGSVVIGLQAAVTVDPGASVSMTAAGSILVDGTIRAPGGTISLVNTNTQLNSLTALTFTPGQMILVAGGATLDVDAQTFTTHDVTGRPFGTVPAGGNILLGGPDVLTGQSTGEATDAFVVVAQGAVLSASGTSATIDPAAGLGRGLVSSLGAQAGARAVPSAGGQIALNSASGIILDGTLLAAAGGPGAAGGTLSVMAETPDYLLDHSVNASNTPILAYPFPDYLATGRDVILVAQYQTSPLIAPTLASATATAAALQTLVGQTQIGMDKLAAGGFASVNLATDDALIFSGNVILTASRSVSLSAGAIGEPPGTGAAQAVIAAPYVALGGLGGQQIYSKNDPAAVVDFNGTSNAAANPVYSSNSGVGGAPYIPSPQRPSASLTVSAGQIDVSGYPAFGQLGAVGLCGGTCIIAQGAKPSGGVQTTQLLDFAAVNLISTGDIRFLAPTAGSGLTTTTLLTAGNIMLQAQQIYPASNASAQIIAGAAFNAAQTSQPTVPVLVEQLGGLITIIGDGGLPPALPQTVEGTLRFVASTIDQGGVIAAPLGFVQLGATTNQQTNAIGASGQYGIGTFAGGSMTLVPATVGGPLTQTVRLQPGSLTSVSALGLTIADGGTTDGTTYSGAPLLESAPQITLAGASIIEQPGAVLDLSGGGRLAGIGFITGAGGSVDTLATPALTLTNGGKQNNDQVYAIVVGPQPAVAEASLEGYSSPGIGAEITIPAGIPGLPAGTYTLLPADNALRPGGFRVELTSSHGLSAQPFASPNGSYQVDVQTPTAGTALAPVVPTVALVSPAATVRDNSQYDEETYSQYVTAQAALEGLPRAGSGFGVLAIYGGFSFTTASGTIPGILPEDGGVLSLSFLAPTGAGIAPPTGSALSIAGTNRFGAAPGGYDGAAVVSNLLNTLEITPQPASPVVTAATLAIDAADLNRLGASLLSVGGTLDAGATLLAPEIVFTGSTVNGTISTIGRTGSLPVSSAGVTFALFTSLSASLGATQGLVAANGVMQFVLGGTATPTGALVIGPEATLAAGGTLYFGAQSLALPTTAQYGAQNLQLSTNTLLIGTQAALATAQNVPPGVTLTGDVLATLLAGNPATGAPPLQSLTLTASNAVDIFGPINLATGALQQFELNTPSIQGFSTSPTDLATITANTFVWNGVVGKTNATVSAQAPAAIPFGAGSGNGGLRISANTIIFGYGDGEVPVNEAVSLDRVLLGFSKATFAASQAIIARDLGTLIAYQSGGLAATQPATGTVYAGTGGSLTLDAPLLTAANAAVLQITAGGPINVINSSGGAANTALAGQGGEIDLNAPNISAGTTFALPSGKLSMLAITGDIDLAGTAAVRLAGQSTTLFDETLASPGGSLVLESTSGNINVAASALIDVSAQAANAGSISATATAGQVALDGSLLGRSMGGAGGSLTMRTGSLTQSSFDALQTVLNAGGFSASRAIEIGSGSIAVTGGAGAANQVRASQVSLSVDQGALTVSGVIDASGATPGAISLAAGGNLTIAAGAVLDAHGSVLQTDSTGAPIDSANQARIQLTVATGEPGAPGTGVLTIGSGVVLNVASPETVTEAGIAPGVVTISVPRLLSATGAETGKLPLQIANVGLNGVGSLLIDAFRAYAPTTNVTTQTGTTATIAQADFAAWNVDSAKFVALAEPFGALSPTLAAAFGSFASSGVLHLRPGVAVETTGNLSVIGDINLAGYRYTSLDPAHVLASAYGSGEPGALVLLAGGTLTINGSMTDGFAVPDDGSGKTFNPDDNGWVLNTQSSVLLGNVVLPATAGSVTLPGSDTGTATTTTSFANTGSLNYAITIDQNTINPGVTLPVPVTLGAAITLPVGTTLAANVTNAAGTVMTGLSQGTTLSANQVVPAGDTLGVGFVTPVSVTTLGQTQSVPAGTRLTSNATVTFSSVAPSGHITVPPGDSITIVETVGTTTKNVTYTTAAGAKTDTTIPSTAASSGNITFVSGQSLPFAVTSPVNQGQSWPAGASLADFAQTVVLEAPVTVSPGAIIPANTNLLNAIPLRLTSTVTGTQGLIYADAAPLPQGTLSWSISAVAGANTASANPLSVQSASALAGTGNLVLDDPHVGLPSSAGPPQSSYSVIRTGTGDLNLVAGGNLSEASLFGVYTAGAAVTGIPAGSQIASYAVTSGIYAAAAAANATAYRGIGGGNLTLSAQGSLSGDIYAPATSSNVALNDSPAIGQWLWRQGGADLNEPASWGVNTGTYAPAETSGSTLTGTAALVGFTGFGTLGGGNVTITAGGNAGVVAPPTGPTTVAVSGGGLVVAVASGSYVDADGVRQTTGGGNLMIAIGGVLNPAANNKSNPTALDGTITDLRGTAMIDAGAVGQFINPVFGSASSGQNGLPSLGIYVAANTALATATPTGGLTLVPGDADFVVSTRGSLALNGMGDATRVPQYGQPAGTADAQSWFTLWTDQAAVSLSSAGGNVAPLALDPANTYLNAASPVTTGTEYEMPSRLRIAADAGSILQTSATAGTPVILLAPSPNGQLDLLAGGSIINTDIVLSGAVQRLVASVADPADYISSSAGVGATNVALTQASNDKPALPAGYPLFAFGPDVAAPDLHANDNSPAHVYAGGDILYSVFGQTVASTGNYYPVGSTVAIPVPTLTLAAKPIWVRAAGDIVGLGTNLSLGTASALTLPSTLSQMVVLDTGANSLSLVQAGRDIVQANLNVYGSGTLEISAGRELYQANAGTILSSGAVPGGSQVAGQGAALDILVGMGAAGPDDATFGNLYFNPDNLADPTTPLQDQLGKVLDTYQNTLLSFMQARGYAGPPQGALTAFHALEAVQQTPLLLSILFDELSASGEAAANPTSRFYKSYLQGSDALATLFPTANAYQGDLTIFGSSGIKTVNGGSIDLAVPGGQTLLGVAGQPASANSGVLTQGSGNIGIYSQGSVLLGQSRVFTTFGGGITIWSAEGDINAGQGAKTTQVFTPPSITYDLLGDITLAPTVPATGAGIATLAPVPGIAAGDVVLAAPQGTIDAGEAGVRSTGNVALAATVVLNASNVQAQGKTTGAPTVPVANVGANLAAATTAGTTAASQNSLPSATPATTASAFITVEVDIGSGEPDNQRKKKPPP